MKRHILGRPMVNSFLFIHPRGMIRVLIIAPQLNDQLSRSRRRLGADKAQGERISQRLRKQKR